jgi:hypothetical protein
MGRDNPRLLLRKAAHSAALAPAAPVHPAAAEPEPEPAPPAQAPTPTPRKGKKG